MPRIFDNINQSLLPALVDGLNVATRADFCVGYFNLRGWRQLDGQITDWAGTPSSRVRLLVGMQSLPQDELRALYRTTSFSTELDNQTALRLKRRMADHFREQLTYGTPSNEDEAGLRRLSEQLKSGKVIVKLSLRRGLHAKLYLIHRADRTNPIIPYLGSSNLTLAGLSNQGELNVDVLDGDAATKLAGWFEDRWDDRWCLDISAELAAIIDASWASADGATPYQIYIKMAYHLSAEARAGMSEFTIPKEMRGELFEYQIAAVKIAAHHLNKRGGVVLGDVVGLGKTLMATTLAKLFEEDQDTETLILCPKNLEKMWNDYVDRYRLRARVIPTSRAQSELPELRRYRVIVIDESHNLRNTQGRRYAAIRDYIEKNESKCILLSATPYNKTYLDLSSQLALFLKEDTDLGIRPEALLREIGETEFVRRHQAPLRSLKAFEKSEYPDDWRELMRLYMVRRTRSFIQRIYTKPDEFGRRYLEFSDGTRSYFPARVPRTVRFTINDNDPNDPYARLYAPSVVNAIEALVLPRYGLGNYIETKLSSPPNEAENKQIANLGRAGKRLIGFCRTNLFKRLESGGTTFVQSLERHLLRNHVYLHAIENDLPVPLGTQTSELLDSSFNDDDSDAQLPIAGLDDDATADDLEPDPDAPLGSAEFLGEAQLRQRAAQVYADYAGPYRKRFKWLRADLFTKALGDDLRKDARAIREILQRCGRWNPERDAKLEALWTLITQTHPAEKILVFTQFADTVQYLETQLKARGVTRLSGVVGSDSDPTAFAWRFSPRSNSKTVNDELRVLIASDVLSEGQNLQDAHIVVNFDLPWAIIRLIQRAGRVDRIGQTAETITCYSFLPADGVERIIQLRGRVKTRLRQNAEVIGTDEQFFEDDDPQTVLDLYNEKAGLLDNEGDAEVDLASYAFSIWKAAIEHNPRLEAVIRDMPSVVYAAKPQIPNEVNPNGVLVYARTAQGNDALAWVNEHGQSVTQSQFKILEAARCEPDTPSAVRVATHHDLVARGVALIAEDEKTVGGQLGRPSGARFKTYERLKRHAERIRGSLFENNMLYTVIDEIYRYPLRQSATDTLNRQIKSGIRDEDLSELVLALRDDDRLCVIQEDTEGKEPEIICSLGLIG